MQWRRVLLFGVIAWAAMSAPVARLLPDHMAEKMAAATLDQD